MATRQDSRVTLRVDQNGAEELTPPGQAILVRGVETLKVMTPFLPDDERAQRLADLRQGQVELTYTEKLVLKMAKSMMQEGKKPTRRAMFDQLQGQVSKHNLANALRHLRELNLLTAESAEAEDES